MARIPQQLTQAVRVGALATPSIALAAPGPGVSWVVKSLQSRMVNAGAGNIGVALQVVDAVFGVLFSWEIATNAAAGATDIDDFDSGEVTIIGNPATAMTINWSGATPAGGNSGGMIRALAELQG